MKYLRLIFTPVQLPHWMMDLSFAVPRILCGFFLACMFGGDKFGVPWAIADTGLGLFEVVDWFPNDVAKFGGLFALAPEFFAWMGAASEAIGGMFLLLGLFTRPASFMVLCTMLVAIFFQKWGQGLWGMLPALGFLWVALYNLLLGGGKFSLDYLLCKKMKSYYSFKKSNIIMVGCFLFVSPVFLEAQIEGKGASIDKYYDIDNFKHVQLGLNASYDIVPSEQPYLKISAQENIQNYISKEVNDDTLKLQQIEWIRPSKEIAVVIGIPSLHSIQLTSWSTVIAHIIKEESLHVQANIGTIQLEGKVKYLDIHTEQANIIAGKLIAENAVIEASGYAQLQLNITKKAELNLDVRKVKLTWLQKPEIIIGDYPGKKETYEYDSYFDTRFIPLTIKNNSWNRHEFYVEGPKPDQTTFSYGFPMMPGQKRKESWSIGTKVYKVKSSNQKLLVCEITANDEGKVVDLFKK